MQMYFESLSNGLQHVFWASSLEPTSRKDSKKLEKRFSIAQNNTMKLAYA